MLALGKGDLVKRIETCFEKNTPMPEILHEEAIEPVSAISCCRRNAGMCGEICRNKRLYFNQAHSKYDFGRLSR